MTKEQILARWKEMTDITSQENLVGFFQKFRPHGNGLAAALEGVVGANEILPRLLELYEVTADGWQREDAYFVVKNPKPCSKEQARQLTNLHLQKMREVAREIGNRDLRHLLEHPPQIEVICGKVPWPPGQNDLESLIYEVRTDFILSLTPLNSHILLLNDAFYHIACDYFLRDYILWPLYRHSTTVVEPFKPYFELWKYGAGFRFPIDDTVKVYVPSLI